MNAVPAKTLMEVSTAIAPLRTLQFGSLRLASRYLLSPLAGYTNLAFRLALREVGGLGLATTDLVNARALLRGSMKSHELIATCPADAPVAVQIYGAEAKEMSEAARWLEEYGVHSVDINMGCPVHKVVRGGGGSAMLCDSGGGTVDLVRAVVEAVRIPVTVKMRLGWDDANLTAPAFARAFEQAGVAAVMIHGRTRAQGFGGRVNLDGIRAVVAAVERIPVIGNGDIRSLADAERMLQYTGCAGISIGRGALLNPWIFAQLCRWEQVGTPGAPPSYGQRLDFMERHYRLLVGQRMERFASLTYRKVAGWYSKVLKPGRLLHERMMRLSTVAEFEAILAELRAKGPPPHWQAGDVPEIAVPKGPNERW
jgi:tRNA-dihydrouridine synthase B